jgi:serine/threonine protein kinase
VQLPARIGKYELIEFLGGGMSHVYRARDTVLGRAVAIKILTEQGVNDPDAKARFLLEAKMAGNIAHENVISLYDYGEEQGRPYIVMEFLVGRDLKDAIKKGETGDLDNRLRIAKQVARALEYVHSRKIVHRDIKPENIHLDAAGRAKLMDFGIAKSEGLSLTRTGFALGTPYYMAPEQVRGEEPTEAMDIYAFGILLFELLCGQKPIQGETVERLFYAILNEPVNLDPLRSCSIPEPLALYIGRLTAKNPAERPRTFGEVASFLEQFIRTPTTLATAAVAPPPPTASKKGGLSGRAIAFGLAGLIALVAGGLIYYARPKPKPPLPDVIQTDNGDMVLIRGGRALYGPRKETVIVPDFYIDKTEVSNASYARFCKDKSWQPPEGFESRPPDEPVVNITFTDAQEYAQWAKKRLPNAQEWEKASRGSEGFDYPWGNTVDPTRANVKNNPNIVASQLMPVTSFPGGASPFGVLNMVGNAAEYVSDRVVPSPPLLQQFANALTPPPQTNEPWYSVKGGSFETELQFGVLYEYAPLPARYSNPSIGFRCVRNPQNQE